MSTVEENPEDVPETVTHLPTTEPLDPDPSGRPARRALGADGRAGPYLLLGEPPPATDDGVVPAQDERLGRAVRVRLLRRPAAADPSTRSEFAREARTLAGLGHPHLANGVLEADLDADEPYVALSDPPGKPWIGFALPARKTGILYPNRRLAESFLRVAQALRAVHRAGLVHGNIRPDCLRWTADGTLLTGCGEPPGSVAESIPFAAPKDGDGDPRRRDLHALAASVFGLVTGRPPQPEDGPEAAKDLNPGLSRDLARMLGRCLGRDPEDRPIDLDKLIVELRGFLATEIVHVPFARRSLIFLAEAWVVLIAGAGLVLLAGWAAGWFPQPRLTVWAAISLYLPSLLYWIVVDGSVPGGSWLSRKLGGEILDRGGDLPGGRPWVVRCLAKLVPLAGIGLLICCASSFASEIMRRQHHFHFVRNAENRVFAVVDDVFFPAVIMLLVVPGGAGLFLIPTFLATSHEARNMSTPTDLAVRGQVPAGTLIAPWDTWSGSTRAFRRPAEAPADEEEFPQFDLDGDHPLAQVASYNLIRPLGSGAMGTVYLGWDRALGRRVAVKLIRDGRHHLESRDRFEREARLAARIDHPNVAAVFGAGLWDDEPYIAMEYIEGETLKSRVDRLGPMGLAEAWAVAVQVAEGLEAADREGIIHRDVKPANIMIDRDGMARVADFGVARSDRGDELHLTHTGAVVGTPQFMPPEQARGEPIDRRCDMYALGMTLHFLLTGRTAFAARSREDLLALQLTTEPESLLGRVPGLNAEQDHLILRLLARDRNRRFPSYSSLLELLREDDPRQLAIAPASLRFLDGLFFTVMAWMFHDPVMFLALAQGGKGDIALTTGSILFFSPMYWIAWQVAVMGVGVACVVYRPGPSREPSKIRSKEGLFYLAFSLLGWPGFERKVGLRVARTDGRRIGPGQALARLLVNHPWVLPWPVVALAGKASLGKCGLAILIASLAVAAVNGMLLIFQERRRLLGDLVAGTEVHRVRPAP